MNLVLKNKMVMVSLFVGIFVIIVILIISGWIKFIFFLCILSEIVCVFVIFFVGILFEVINKYVIKMLDKVKEL